MQIVQTRSRSVSAAARCKRYTPERARAEALFNKPVTVTKPRILEDAPKPAVPTAVRATAVEETEHEKVFRLVREGRFEEAARIAARLINAGNDDGFFIYGNTPEFAKAQSWHNKRIAADELHANVHTITVERAQVLLINNQKNRRVKAAGLADLMRDITSGRFLPNGESIIVSNDGTVNDGQHRCFAVILTGLPIDTVVSYGASKSSMRTVDIGSKRQGSDRLAIAGVKNHVPLSALASLVFELMFNRKPTPAESEDFYIANGEDFQLAHSVCGGNLKGVGHAPMGAASYYLLNHGYSPESIRDFFASVRSGELLAKRDPRMILHRAIFNAEHKIKLSREQWVSAFVAHFEKHQQKKNLTSPLYDIKLNWN